MAPHSKFSTTLMFVLGTSLGFLTAMLFQSSTVINPNPKHIPSALDLYRPKPIPTIFKREELPFILEREKMTIGVELGVKYGEFAAYHLKNWPSCKEYHLVDVWKKQKNYLDSSNRNDFQQEVTFKTAKAMVKPWLKSEGGEDKVNICRNFTTICAKRYPDMYFDYIYVDARHDYKGALDDISQWWPKLKKGGIMAGHDYLIQSEVPKNVRTGAYTEDWRLNYDGTIDHSGRIVRGAVDDFFMPSAALPSMPASSSSLSQAARAPITILSFDGEYERQVVPSYSQTTIWRSWMVRK